MTVQKDCQIFGKVQPTTKEQKVDSWKKRMNVPTQKTSSFEWHCLLDVERYYKR